MGRGLRFKCIFWLLLELLFQRKSSSSGRLGGGHCRQQYTKLVGMYDVVVFPGSKGCEYPLLPAAGSFWKSGSTPMRHSYFSSLRGLGKEVRAALCQWDV